MRFLLPTLLLAACAVPDDDGLGGQTGEEMITCAVIASTPLGPDEASALGFAPADIAAFADGAHPATLLWADGATTDLTVTVTTGAAVFADYEWVDEDGDAPTGAVPELACADAVELEATVGFATGDGAFAESWPLTLHAASPGAASFWRELDLDALSGSYAVTEVDPTQYDAVRVFVDGTLTPAGTTGALSGQAEKANDETASAESFAVATW